MGQNEDARQLAELTAQVIETMTPREQRVVSARFGPERKTLQELGQELGVSGERIRQIEAKALRQLRTTSARERSKT
jgi:RNA polymerase primary sigma factor